MKGLIFGATGMIGQGVLLECLRDPAVQGLVALGRTPTGISNPKLSEIVHIVHNNPSNYQRVDANLVEFDACFFCLGVTSNGTNEETDTRIAYGFTVAAAGTVSRLNPGMTFIFVSGSGTDSSEKGRLMWARVKGRAENAIFRLPLNAYAFRPGFIQPLDGIESKTPSYRFFHKLLGPRMRLLRRALPSQILTTREIGRAMLMASRHG